VFLDSQGGVAAAGGFLLQTLPPSDADAVEALARQTERAPPLSQLLLRGSTPEEVLRVLLGEMPFTALERRPLRFQCSCNLERVEQALVTLGAEALREMVAAGEDTEISCEFCRQRYRITACELERLLTERM
jgi:molecular chaperone Hsp33